MDVSSELLTQRLELADALLAGRNRMFEPRDLPCRYGRVVRAIDRALTARNSESVVGGGWAVWRHGYIGGVTQDVDIVLPERIIEEFLVAAAVQGFEVYPHSKGRWPKLCHRETAIEVDALPEGARPGSAGRLAPTTIPHPRTMGGICGTLEYMKLASLVEMKLAAGRLRDEADVVELIRHNPDQLEELRQHMRSVHANYASRLEELVQQANDAGRH